MLCSVSELVVSEQYEGQKTGRKIFADYKV